MKLTNMEKVFIKALNDKVYNRLDDIMGGRDYALLTSRTNRHDPMKLLLEKPYTPNKRIYCESIRLSGNSQLLKDLYTKMYGYIIGDYISRKYSRDERFTGFVMRIAKPESLQDIITDENLSNSKFGKICSTIFYLDDNGYCNDTLLSLDFSIDSPYDQRRLDKIMNVHNRTKGFVSDKNYINVFMEGLQAIYKNYLEKIVMWAIY